MKKRKPPVLVCECKQIGLCPIGQHGKCPVPRNKIRVLIEVGGLMT